MISRNLYFHPFDSVYADVSRRIREHRKDLIKTRGLIDPQVVWLSSVIELFQSEADIWHTETKLDTYREELDRLKLPILQLAGGAYLHICYDLPRVLADCWPGLPPFAAPSELEGQRLYRTIGKYFPEAINDISCFREAVGIFGPAYRWELTQREMEKWIKLLRAEAWFNAKELRYAGQPRRAELEAEILALITVTMSNVGARAVWDLLSLTPPAILDAGSIMATSFIALENLIDNKYIIPILLIVLVAAVGTSQTIQARNVKRLTEMLAAMEQAEARKLSISKDYISLDLEVADQDRLADSLAATIVSKMGSDIRIGLQKIFKDSDSRDTRLLDD